MSTCRSCGARIVWALTPAGKRMPVDADPVPGGNITLTRPRSGPPEARVVGPDPMLDDDGDRYLSHFVTCRNAAAHRQPRGPR